MDLEQKQMKRDLKLTRLTNKLTILGQSFTESSQVKNSGWDPGVRNMKEH